MQDQVRILRHMNHRKAGNSVIHSVHIDVSFIAERLFTQARMFLQVNKVLRLDIANNIPFLKVGNGRNYIAFTLSI